MSADTNPIAGRHLVRYGIAADQKFLLGEFLPTYDQIVLNANIVAHMPSALANFLSERARKPYLIDPQTHAFQHDITHLQSTSEASDGKITLKRSISKLLDEYGEPVKTCVGSKNRPLLPEDLKDATVRKDFCERVLRFQLEVVENEVERSDSKKYYRYVSKAKGVKLAPGGPSLVVAPYFYLTSATFEDWLPVNIDCAKDAAVHAARQSVPLGLQIVISRNLLSDAAQSKQLIARYTNADLKPSVFLIWVDSFSELDASKRELVAFIDLVNALGSVAEVVNLYGGFFSVALSRLGIAQRLTGIVHGLEYGEDRGVVPVGGGFPVAKYYLPAIHARLPFRQALRAVRAMRGLGNVDEFRSRICDCGECARVVAAKPETDFAQYGETRTITYKWRGQIVRREVPTPETREHCVRHYMWRKAAEYNDPLSSDELARRLQVAGDKLAGALGLASVSHCAVWTKVLKERIGEA